jgi:hypothetical protein
MAGESAKKRMTNSQVVDCDKFVIRSTEKQKRRAKSPVVDCDKFVIRNTKNHKGTYRIGRIDRNQISKSYSVVNGKSDRRSRA